MMFGLMAETKRCRICGSHDQKWTEEHAYPVWLRKQLRDVFGPEWQGRPTLLKPVCKPCQERLNVCFENPAAPILKAMLAGSVIELSPEGQRIIGGWCVKTALVLTLAPWMNEGPPETHRPEITRQLRELVREGTPRRNATARIAYFDHQAKSTRQPFSFPMDLHRTSTLVMVPGLVCEALTGNRPDLVRYVKATQNDERFLRIWPPQPRTLIWPPPVPLGAWELRDLQEAWTHNPAGVVPGDFPRLRLPMR